MMVIDCDDYNEASTKTGDVARRLLKKYKAAQPGKHSQTVASLTTLPALTFAGRREKPHTTQFTSRNSV
jgi:hypothetical protein